MKKIIKFIPALIFALTPMAALALTNSYGFPDPFAGSSISDVVGNIIRAILSLVGALFFLMFLWGGTRYLTAGGDSEKVKNAKTTLTNAVIGLIIIALSYVIVVAVIDAIDAGQAGVQTKTTVETPNAT